MNNQGQVKIADFGLARKIEPSYSGKLTLRVVTRWYRAPELLLGNITHIDKGILTFFDRLEEIYITNRYMGIRLCICRIINGQEPRTFSR